MSRRSPLRLVAACAAFAMSALSFSSIASGAELTQTPPGSVEPIGTIGSSGSNYKNLGAGGAKFVYPSGLEITMTATNVQRLTIGNGGWSPMDSDRWWGDGTTGNGLYSQSAVSTSNAVQVYDEPTCTSTPDVYMNCPNIGSLQFVFNRAVTNPVVHVANLCATSQDTSNPRRNVSASSLGYTIDKANSTFTSSDLTFEKVKGNAALVVSTSRISAPQNANATYSPDFCAYGSIRVAGTLTKITLTLDLDYKTFSGSNISANQIDSWAADASSFQWTAFEGDANPYVSVDVQAMNGTSGVKTLDNGYTNVGDTIKYQYIVSNTGLYALVGPHVVTDDKVASSAISCPTTAIDPGKSITCTSSYTVTEADISAKKIVNSATVSSKTAAGTTATSAASTATVNATANAGATTTTSTTTVAPKATAKTASTKKSLPATGSDNALLGLGVAFLATGLFLVRRRAV
jgi:LPXTG-motif cell wall-anchored protein